MAKTPGLNLPFGIDPVNPVPVDSNYGPYANTAEAIAAIPLSLRYDGLTVQITGSGNYWWEASDLSDGGLKPKSGSGGGLTNPVCTIQMQKTYLPNSLGSPINFIRNDFSTDIDIISAGNTEFSRDDNFGSIFNSAVEIAASINSPANTEWNSVFTDPINNGHGNIQNIETRTYSTFLNALNGNINSNILTTPLIMHDLTTNEYYTFTFTQWTNQLAEATNQLFLDNVPVNGTIITIGTETYVWDDTTFEWTATWDNSVWFDISDAINNNPNSEVYADYSYPITLTAYNPGSFYNGIPTTVSPSQPTEIYFSTPTLTGGSDGGGGFEYTRTKINIGVLDCDGAIHFDDGSQMDSAPSPNIPIARYVYLVQDASDAIRMGGVSSNTYVSFQNAYNAANTLQLSLGGSNKVAIMVGNTTAVAVGNLVLTSNFNSNVIIVGIDQNISKLGNITSTVLGVGIPSLSLFNVTVGQINVNLATVNLWYGGIFTTGFIYSNGGNVWIADNLATNIQAIFSNGASGIPSGNVTCTNNRFLGVGGIIMNSDAANIGTCNINSNYEVIMTSGIQMSITGSTTGTESIGTCSISNNLYVSSGAIYMNTNHLSPVATWGGILISNVGRSSIGGIYVNGTNTAGATPSDLAISNFTLIQVDGYELCLNWRLNTQNEPKGGFIGTFLLNDCTFNYRARVGYRPTTARTNLRFEMEKVRMTGGGIANRGFIFHHSLCTFSSFFLTNSVTASSDWGYTFVNLSASSTQMVGTNALLISNNDVAALNITSRNAGATSSVDDVQLSNNKITNLYIEVAQGDMNFNIDQCSSKTTRFVASGTATSIKRNIITNSDLNTTIGNTTLQGAAPRPKLSMRNSYLNIYTTNALAGSIDIIAYSSFIDTIAQVGSVSTYTGTVYTTTVKRLTTDNIAGLTLNASYDQSI